MKRFGLAAAFLLLFSLTAFAHEPLPQATWGQRYYVARPYARPQRGEAQRLRRHQLRERYACSHSWFDGRCNHLRQHQRNEWRRLYRHQRRENTWRWGNRW